MNIESIRNRYYSNFLQHKFSELLFKIIQRCDDKCIYNAINSFYLDDSTILYMQHPQFQSFYDKKLKRCCCDRCV